MHISVTNLVHSPKGYYPLKGQCYHEIFEKFATDHYKDIRKWRMIRNTTKSC